MSKYDQKEEYIALGGRNVVEFKIAYILINIIPADVKY